MRLESRLRIDRYCAIEEVLVAKLGAKLESSGVQSHDYRPPPSWYFS